ncbi:MAG: xanthine dehydrogenase family protein molybdopterin-binding subunit [Gammaproteobacteria bacterium]|nr:xanthine dehydrogenase family protein molybdopterin-binding subunit [Gammaproteobacteria bacterium]
MTKTSGWIGKRYSRKEDKRLIIGRGEYVADIKVDNPLHVKFVRSSVAHAKITGIDTREAEKLPGVVAVLTGEDIRDEIKPLPTPPTMPLLPAHYPRHWPLAVDRVKFNGEPVAVVVAEDKYVAQDAAELVMVDYEDLPVITDPEFSLTAEAPVIHEDMDSNEMFAMNLTGGVTEEEQTTHAKRIEEIFSGAEVVIKERFRTHRCGVMPMETRGAIAEWDVHKGLRCWMSTQRPHIDRLVFADLFDIPQNKVHVSAPLDQGGAFGVKAPVYREPLMVVYLARRLGRAIRWIESREEHLMAVSQERDQIHDIELAADNNGKILALRDRIVADNGDGCEGVFWGFVMPFYGAAVLPNAYHIPDCDISIRVAVTNKSALSPARAFGTMAGRFALDRAVDLLARRVGRDPAELRRANMITELPCDVATGVHYDAGDFVKVWDKLMDHIDLPAFRREQEEARAAGRFIGLGFGISVHASGVASEALVPMEGQPGYGSAAVKIDSQGTVQVFEGDAPQGQGHETTMSQIVAEVLGIDPGQVEVKTGDTQSTPFATGTFGARGGSYTGSAVAKAAGELREKMARVAIHDAGIAAEPADINFEDGRLLAADGSEIAEFAALADRIIMKPLDLPDGVDASLERTAFFEAKEPMMSFSASAIRVAVDPDSGEFTIDRYVTAEDVGRVINPQIVEGQVHGGLVQGLSNAMFEEFIYDENGQQLSTTMENYKLANAADVPNMEVLHADTPCEHTPLGTRGMGEGTPGPVPGALCNAICDALQPFGIEITELPIRPDRLYRLLQQRKSA